MMRQRNRFTIPTAGIAIATAAGTVLAPGAGTAGADEANVSTARGPTTVPLSAVLRRCDFSNDTHIPPARLGTAYALISTTTSHQVVAEVNLSGAVQDMVYRVRMIEMPRPTLTCDLGDPGVVFGLFTTDDLGNGSVTISEDVMPGATGAWVYIEGPAGGSSKHISGEFYTSDFVAPV